ncbi:hypothetical protein ACFOLK_18830 [Marinococcus halophilus]|uniref:hypothetical protein n=1 Tax=Marinococcus halophilus TaxID=1371 RepID=UPI00360BB343
MKQWTKDGHERVPRATAWQIEQMYAVINHRYLITCRFSFPRADHEELVEVDDALASRMCRCVKSFLVTITGPKKRLKLPTQRSVLNGASVRGSNAGRRLNEAEEQLRMERVQRNLERFKEAERKFKRQKLVAEG